ncbi:putative bifunctional diguanylate cyclase/phosphodiesterase [Zoogloea sp.]|uniref:putative bifunctional diguanylate cyclase/phosphodiesterase n=1 Tax=Zoogloea sp. TaxID=49181 RepID=UPI0035AF4A02
MSQPDDPLVFLDEEGPEPEAAFLPPWRILVVDDDRDVHETTSFALAGIRILGRPLALLHAMSAADALETLRRQGNVAVILLDVVMESEDAGLRLVDAIRNDLRVTNTRIILRTGQPGHAPECETITRYDINDYKTKGELTQAKLFATLTSAIRAYDQLLRLEATRAGLEKIVAASNQFIADQGLQAFAEGVITQIAGLLGVEPEGLVCAAAEDGPAGDGEPRFRVIAAAGHFRHLIQRRLSEIEDPWIAAQLTDALQGRRNLVHPRSMALYFRKTADEGFAAFIDSARPIRAVDQELLEVFCTNIALCAKNVDLVAELRRDAFVDRQMGLPNRTALVCEINACLARHDGMAQALAIVDVDQFASANDVLGHDYGDALLRLTAQRLAELPGGVFVARLAGDAFAVLGPAETVNGPAIQGCFRAPMLIEAVHHPVSVCVGLVALQGDRRSGIEYLKDSYLALKRAKAQGLAQTVCFSPALGAEARERAQLLRDLRLAFDQSRLSLVYQPQVALATGRVTGVEALLRWRREDRPEVPPDDFIPIAEQSGLIVGMGSWLLQAALLALQRFRAAGHPALRMAVNVSPIQLRQPDFLAQVREALAETGCVASALEVEVTESVAVGGLEPAAEHLRALREMGVTVAIDDFGTGYSSLSYLERLPADRLKIDRSFMRGLERGEQGARIARTIIVLGRELGLTVLAEGVESAEVAAEVARLGCSEAQGFHYARPMEEEACLAWLAGCAS